MARKTPAPERPEGIPEGFGWTTVDVAGTTYTLRELSVDEADEIDEQTRGADGQIAWRVYSRMSLAKAIVSPAVTFDELGGWPSSRYTELLAAYNRLNAATVPNA